MQARLATIALLSILTLPVVAAGPYPLHELAEKFGWQWDTEEVLNKESQNDRVKIDAAPRVEQDAVVEYDANSLGW